MRERIRLVLARSCLCGAESADTASNPLQGVAGLISAAAAIIRRVEESAFPPCMQA